MVKVFSCICLKPWQWLLLYLLLLPPENSTFSVPANVQCVKFIFSGKHIWICCIVRFKADIFMCIIFYLVTENQSCTDVLFSFLFTFESH